MSAPPWQGMMCPGDFAVSWNRRCCGLLRAGLGGGGAGLGGWLEGWERRTLAWERRIGERRRRIWGCRAQDMMVDAQDLGVQDFAAVTCNSRTRGRGDDGVGGGSPRGAGLETPPHTRVSRRKRLGVLVESPPPPPAAARRPFLLVPLAVQPIVARRDACTSF